MTDVNLLTHRIYLADIERLARRSPARPMPGGWRTMLAALVLLVGVAAALA